MAIISQQIEALAKKAKEKVEDNYVTDKKYYMDKRLKFYCDQIIAERLSKESEDDALIICEGDEGTGKSSMAGHIGYYIAQQTNRGFSGKTFYLDTDEMMKFAANTYRQVICWDEPAVSGMSDEWWNEEQRKLKKLLVMVRQHQHCYIFNFARFHKFSEFFIVDRSLCMIKTFKRNKTEHGHFMYFNSQAKEQLWFDWKQKHLKNYSGHANFVGRFFTPLDFFLTPEEYADYKLRKDKAIVDLVDNVKKPNSFRESLLKMQYNLSKIKIKELQKLKTHEELASYFGTNAKQLERWRFIPNKYPKIFGLSNENSSFTKENEQNSVNKSSDMNNSLQSEGLLDDS